jgi:hypothetical protein
VAVHRQRKVLPQYFLAFHQPEGVLEVLVHPTVEQVALVAVLVEIM